MQKKKRNRNRSVVVFAPAAEAPFHALILRLKCDLFSSKVEAFHDLNLFANRFRQLNNGISVAVLLLPTQDDVDDMLSIQILFEDVPVILILQERDTETIRKAHCLAPRYMADMDGDFQDIVAVLAKIAALDRRAAV